MTISDDTYVADLLGLAGGVNVFGREAGALSRRRTPQESSRAGRRRAFLPERAVSVSAQEKHEAMTEELFGKERRSPVRRTATTIAGTGVRTLDGLKAMRELRKTLEWSAVAANKIWKLQI